MMASPAAGLVRMMKSCAQPNMNPANRPKDRLMYMYSPPVDGMRVPSSAYTAPPISTNAPTLTHAMITVVKEGKYPAMMDGVE